MSKKGKNFTPDAAEFSGGPSIKQQQKGKRKKIILSYKQMVKMSMGFEVNLEIHPPTGYYNYNPNTVGL